MASIISAGTTSGTALNFTGDTSGNLGLTAPSGTVTAATTTGGFVPPTGTTAQRNGSPANGELRYNTTTNQLEAYSGTAWVTLTTQAYTVTYLVIAGGASGGYGNNGFYQTNSGFLLSPWNAAARHLLPLCLL
jgi:hypothetical protein